MDNYVFYKYLQSVGYYDHNNKIKNILKELKKLDCNGYYPLHLEPSEFDKIKLVLNYCKNNSNIKTFYDVESRLDLTDKRHKLLTVLLYYMAEYQNLIDELLPQSAVEYYNIFKKEV